jgi:hypothetical protein
MFKKLLEKITGKKLGTFLLSILLEILNKKYGWELPSGLISGVGASAIIGQAYQDGKMTK